MFDSRFTRLAGTTILLLAFAAACGETTHENLPNEVEEPIPTPEIDTFVVAPEEIEAGSKATLRWAARNVAAISIEDESSRPVPVDDLEPAGGMVEVQPTETTTYTLTAIGPDPAAEPAWRTVTVYVRPAPPVTPVIEEFTASPASVAAGGAVVLSWRTSNAAVIALEDDADHPIPLGGADPASGQVTVHPTRSPTVYYLTAVAPGGGRATEHVSVTVSGLPRVTRFYLDPLAPVHPGGSVTLFWETENTTRVVIRQGETVLVDTTTELSGSRVVTLTDNASFTLEASGTAGLATAQVLAQVGPDVVSFTASERVVRANDPVLLSWSLAEADRAVIDGPGDFQLAVPNDQLASGSATVNVVAGGDFVLRAFRQDVPRTAAIAIDVTEAPRIRELSVDRTQVTASLAHPATVTVSWVQDGAEHCTLYANTTVVPGYESFDCGPTGSATVQLTGTASLRLVAANEHGSHTLTVNVEAIPPAEIVSFTRTPARRVSPGESVEVAWEVTGAVSITLEKDGVALPVGSTNFTGSTNETLVTDTLFVLTALNALGFPTQAQLVAPAGPPVVLSAAAEPDFVAIGAAFELRWTADGGDLLSIHGPGGELYTTTDPAQIDAGSATLLAPVEAGEYTYTVAATNGGGTGSLEVTVIASDGPMIRSFTAAPLQVSLGQSVTFTWSVDDDPAGHKPNLSLTDNYGHDFTADLAAKDPNNGSLTITPAEEGQHVYTLVATTEPGRRPHQAQVVVEVTVPPFLHTFTATPDRVSTQGGTVVPSVVLAWESENAVEVALFHSDESGAAIPPAFHRVSLANEDPQAVIDAGSFTVGPTETHYYVAQAKNRVGTVVQKWLRVIVDPPEILTFEFTPPEITEGSPTTLSWTTRNATSVALEPAFLPIADPYIDLTGTGTSVAWAGTEDSGRWTINFPAGFTFPWFGTQPTGLIATTDGWITFDTSYSSADYTNSDLPDSSNPALQLAPFWDDGKTYASTELLWELRQSPEGQHLVIQWKGLGFYGYPDPIGDLNFEVVLWENGDFDFRYGTMSSPDPAQAAGNSATIGFQSPDRSRYGVMSYNTAVSGGLSGRSWRYLIAPLSPNGSITFAPGLTSTYKLRAFNPDTDGEAETTITVWQYPSILQAGAQPVAPSATLPFEIAWSTTEANMVRVLDTNGAVLCVETNPAKVANGSCTHTEPTAGTRTYTVEASNGPPGNPVAVVTRTISAVVVTNLQVTTFEVLPGEFVAPGTQLTIRWASTGASMMYLFSCEPGKPQQCVDLTPAGADPAIGTLSHTPAGSAEYWFYIYDTYSRMAQASQPVWVGAPSVDTFEASAAYVAAGSPVTLTWSTTDAVSVALSPSTQLPAPAVETTGILPFIDILASGSPVTMAGDEDSGRWTVHFPDGFTFPWFGQAITGLIATTDGWITFNTSYSSSDYSNSDLPDSSNPDLQLAPFWDDGRAYPHTQLLWELRQSAEGRHLVVQWQNLGFYAYPVAEGDITFQVVLWENGTFDFRYGAMSSPNAGEAEGGLATIGYQSPDRSHYEVLGYNTEFSPGLAFRSWRFAVQTPTSGSTVVTPTESTAYRLCASNASLYTDCKERRVVVVKPGDLLFTEAMIAPASADAEWFELRNLSPEIMDLAGWTLASGAGEVYHIPTHTPVLVAPGDYIVFARSGDPAANGGLASPHVYGNALTLVDATDTLQLSLGPTTIDSLLWDANWTIPTTGSLEFEVSKMARNPAANDAFANWCASTASYGSGVLAGSPGSMGNGCLNTGAFEYYWFDPFATVPFLDISTTGTDVSSIFGSTYYTPAIPLGFTLPYFADTATTMHIGRHGYVALTPQTNYYSSNASIPSSSAPNGFVAAFWDYVYYSSGVSTIHHQLKTVDGHQVMIVQWTRVSGGDTTYGSLDFQIQLWDTGDIALAYRNVVKLSSSYGDYNQGSSATIGIENVAGNQAIQVFYGSSSSGGPIRSGTSYLFRRKPATPAP